MHLSIVEVVVVLVVIALFAGPKQIPKLTKAITESVHSMKKEIKKEEQVISIERYFISRQAFE